MDENNKQNFQNFVKQAPGGMGGQMDSNVISLFGGVNLVLPDNCLQWVQNSFGKQASPSAITQPPAAF